MTKKAGDFRALHHGGKILRLPNAWDVASSVDRETGEVVRRR